MSGGKPLFKGAQEEDGRAREEFFQVVYGELHRLAERAMARQARDHTLQPTALVNEAYLRLGPQLGRWRDEDHFRRVAARAMRQILVDHSRGKSARKRRPPGERVELESLVEAYEDRSLDLVALDEALSRLQECDAPSAEVVELHFFGGQPLMECGRLLGISERQIYRRWKAARAFLLRELNR